MESSNNNNDDNDDANGDDATAGVDDGDVKYDDL